jgi:hypothetical protein
MTDAAVDRGAGAGTFVGREAELSLLVAALDQARSGRGSLFLIGGEPGIGKSRLADEFSKHARSTGAPVLWGRSWDVGGAPAYWPWVQALRGYLRNVEPALVGKQLGPAASDLVQILPELRTIVTEPSSPPPDPEWARFQLFDSTASFLRNVARDHEMVVVLDDLHAADTASILFLRFLASQLSDVRMVVLATYRDVELGTDHPLTAALAELVREPTTGLVPLDGLHEQAVSKLIESNTGAAPSARLARELWRETSGNPLFLGEAIRLLQSERRLDEATHVGSLRLAVPAGVREVIVRRVGQLSPAAVRALTIGAALGPEFALDVLRRVRKGRNEVLVDALDEAVRASLLLPVTGAIDRYRFSHDLVREAVNQAQPSNERARLHRQIAVVLEELSGTGDKANSAELAHHYSEAARGGEEPGRSAMANKAQTYATRAAEQALKSLAYEEAARLFRIAGSMLDLRTTDDDETRTELLLAAGAADARAGDLESANAAFVDAAARARRAGVARHLALAALGLGGRLPWARPGHTRDLIPLLEEALMLLGSDDERLRVRLLGRLSCAWRSSPDKRQQSDALSRQALDIARRLDEPATLSYALLTRFWATWWPENPHDRRPLASEVLAVAEAAHDKERVIDARLMLWCIHSELGDMRAAAHELEHLKRVAGELRQPAQLWLGIFPATLVSLMKGAFDTAEELLTSARASAGPTVPSRDDVSAAALQWFLLRRERGKAAEAEPRTRAAVVEFPWYPMHRAALALLLIDQRRHDEAKAIYQGLAADRFAALYRDNEWLLGMSLASEASSLLADLASAAILYEQLEPFAGRHAIGHGEGSVGSVDRYLGLLAATLGRIDEAERHLEAAIRVNQEMGARPWLAHTQRDYAAMLLARNRPGDAARARDLLAEALATARELGMVALERRIGELGAAEWTADDDASAAATSPAVAATFRREGEYWTVAYDGDNFRLRDSKGLHYLARLLAQPGHDIPALELAQAGVAAGAPRRPPVEADLRTSDLGDAGAALDAESKQAYRARLAELQAEIDQAEDWNDPERAERAHEEMEFIARELAQAVGLGGRDRPSGSASERARLAVTRAIRLAMGRIAPHSPALSEHLETTIRTGTYCAYRPDPRVSVEWRA